ncbi:uncharacterized protein LOC143895075 [Temnothorax americanus]|uniref:uncharacterized protein LOC143895075 n=1 Tax=Temnothorax americanus TaxID=1964332 RepID=UPI00406917C1
MSDYCICCKRLSDDNCRNVFDEKLLIDSQEKDLREESDGHVTLRNAVEVITGYTISEIGKTILCETCFHKVESYIKFRSQLVASFGRLNNAQILDLDSSSSENAEITNTSLLSEASDTGSDASKEMTNVNECNYVSNYSDLSSSEAENDSSRTNLQLTFHRYVDDASDYGSDIDDNLNVDTSRSRIQKSDIESDVNVCSGEDDEVSELSVEYERNETVNVSSTESEEDCDYGPTFKKIKFSSRISSPPILS